MKRMQGIEQCELGCCIGRFPPSPPELHRQLRCADSQCLNRTPAVNDKGMIHGAGCKPAENCKLLVTNINARSQPAIAYCNPAAAGPASCAVCHTWMLLSSLALANMCGSVGFHATELTVPLCPSRDSSRSPEGGEMQQSQAKSNEEHAELILPATTLSNASYSGPNQCSQSDRAVKWPRRVPVHTPVARWYTYTRHSSLPVSTKRSSSPPRQERTTNRLCLSCSSRVTPGRISAHRNH